MTRAEEVIQTFTMILTLLLFAWGLKLVGIF